jgi:AraC family transcriptional regulator
MAMRRGTSIICGIEVSDFSTVPAELAHLRIPAQKYAVFSHREHISTIRSAWVTIWNNWLPASGHELIDAPDFERDGPEFDPGRERADSRFWCQSARRPRPSEAWVTQ